MCDPYSTWGSYFCTWEQQLLVHEWPMCQYTLQRELHALMSLSKTGKWTPDGQTLLQTTLFGQNLWHLPLGTGLCLHNPITGLVQPQYTWLCPLSDLEKSKNISHYSWNPPDLGECLAHSISITIHGMKFMANNKVLLWTIKNKQRHMITKENHYVFLVWNLWAFSLIPQTHCCIVFTT